MIASLFAISLILNVLVALGAGTTRTLLGEEFVEGWTDPYAIRDGWIYYLHITMSIFTEFE